MSETAPEPSEVLGEELPPPRLDPVGVVVENPVRTQELPSPLWATGNVTLNIASGAVQLLPPEPRRKRALIFSSATAAIIGHTQQHAQSANGARLAGGIVLELRTSGEVWVAVTADATIVSYVVEYWTE